MRLPRDAITPFNDGKRKRLLSDLKHYKDFLLPLGEAMAGRERRREISEIIISMRFTSSATREERKTFFFPFSVTSHPKQEALRCRLASCDAISTFLLPSIRYIGARGLFCGINYSHPLLWSSFSLSPCSIKSEDSRKSGALHQERQRYQFNLHNIAGLIPVVHLLVQGW